MGSTALRIRSMSGVGMKGLGLFPSFACLYLYIGMVYPRAGIRSSNGAFVSRYQEYSFYSVVSK